MAILLVSLCLAGASMPGPATAQEYKLPAPERPIWFKADQVRNCRAEDDSNCKAGDDGSLKADGVLKDDELGLLVATGNVEFSQNGRTVLADRVTYNHRTDTATASGNVSLLEPTGEVLFADHMELSGDLSEGFMRRLGLRLANDARIAAAGARRIGGNLTVLRKTVYSACETCEDNPDRAPIWQVKGNQAVHDQKNREIIYRDAFLEVFGIPVLYVPYLSQPDPTLERRAGLLAPHYASYEDLGRMIKLPFYFDIAADRDLTVAPTYTTNAGIGSEFTYRQLLENGEYDIWASVFREDVSDFVATHLGIKKFRGHLKAGLRYDIDRNWRAGSNIFLSTDDTFLRKYGFSEETTLDNQLWLERFEGRNYLYAGARHFQGLQADHDDGQSPIVFPILDYSHVVDPDGDGGTWTLNSSFARLTRTDGRNTTRASLAAEWRKPYSTTGGHLYEVRGRVQTDMYRTSEIRRSDPNAPKDMQLAVRVFPQASLKWRYPLALSENGVTRILEPQASIVLAPKAPDTSKIPNEDSLTVEFDDTNVLAMNRYTGIDRVEGGPRVNYGLRGGLYDDSDLKSSFYVGQSHRLDSDTDLGADTGLNGRFSDVVGRLKVSYKSWLDALYRFRFNHDDRKIVRNEVHVEAGPPILKLDARYLSIAPRFIEGIPEQQARLGEREELRARLTSQIARNWEIGVNMHRVLAYGGHSILHGASLVYDDECTNVRLNYHRSFTSDREIQPRDWLFLTVQLKTLGGGSLLGLSR